jgi:hypothetical protein
MLDVVQCEGVDMRVWREERRGSNNLPQELGRRRCRAMVPRAAIAVYRDHCCRHGCGGVVTIPSQARYTECCVNIRSNMINGTYLVLDHFLTT